MPGRELIRFDQPLGVLRQIIESYDVGNRRAILADTLSDFVVFQAVFRCEPVVCTRLVDWVQVFALDVFDERDQERLAVGERADDRRDRVEPGLPGREEATLAGDKLVPICGGSKKDRLEHTSLADRIGELFDRRGVELRPGLGWVARDLRERNVLNVAFANFVMARLRNDRHLAFDGLWDEGLEPPA